MSYGEGTKVRVEKSQAEIVACLKKYGAEEHGLVSRLDSCAVIFKIGAHRYALEVPIPKASAFRPTRGHRGKPGRSAEQLRGQAEQEVWRLIVIAFKAKFGLVERRISTVETEFMAAIKLQDGTDRTVGQIVRQELELIATGGRVDGALLLTMGTRGIGT